MTMSSQALVDAPIIKEERWQAPAVDANNVQKTLQHLWLDIADDKRQASGRPRPTTDGGLMRTRTINLIAIADKPSDAEHIKATVSALTEFFPSRTLILVRERSRHTRGGLDVTVTVEEQHTARFKAPIRFETVTVSTGSGREEVLASVASPILVPELPDFVWRPASPVIASVVLDELADTIDRLIVDTAGVVDPSKAFNYLIDLCRQNGDGVRLSDLAWTRLTPWRQMTAQFFDHAANLPYLQLLDSVSITYAGRHSDGRSGLSSGLLMAGWLCTRLGWRAPGEELVRSRDGWKLTLRAGQRGRSREVILTLRETVEIEADACLGELQLAANGLKPANFKIERVSKEGVATTSHTESAESNRTVYMRKLSEEELLSLELRDFGSDPLYPEALKFAANLWPEGAES
jgi:glucose-6-phosphate dehydrogenase assembly protein OpcA